MTHDPLCPWQGYERVPDNVCWHCGLIAKVRADERSKYVLPDLPRSGDHVDWCRDLACYGCVEVTE